ncbi:band 7 protein CG42540-like isoform X2 [Drosophila obscura]|uniref:band 7 protein CG42540-like isoform X2 n=1 Tax=Drosophila obscura TaxID=7282 RepID=UPI001BB1FA56|nr:band 7 protein CG42540-like isoform X2 [Drosophila obscura]
MSDSTKANNENPPTDGYANIRWGDVDDEPPPPPKPQPERQADKPPPGPADNEAIPEPRVRPSRYITTSEDDKDSGFETIAVYLSLFFVIITFPLSIFLCLIVVKEYHRLLIFRLGRVRKGVRGPGLVWTLPCIDSFVKVDLRTFATEVPSQDILTRDSVTISVDAVLYYCIKDPMDALIQVDDAKEATVLIAQTTLRHIVGAKPLHTLLTSRETLSKEIQLAVDEITERWGVRVERVDVMDISLPYTLQRSLASEAEAVREARAKIISAEGERNASQALKEASDVMSQNKITLQLRHLQILTAIAAEHNCTIIFPFPMEVMTAFGIVEGSSKSKPKPDGKDGDGNSPTSDVYQLGDFTPKVIITEPPNLPEDLRFGQSGEEQEGSNPQKREETENEPELIDERKAEDSDSIQQRTEAENDLKSSSDKSDNDNERKAEDSEPIQARQGDVNDSSYLESMPARVTRLISPHFRRSHARTGIESETDPPASTPAPADQHRQRQAKNEFSYYSLLSQRSHRLHLQVHHSHRRHRRHHLRLRHRPGILGTFISYL